MKKLLAVVAVGGGRVPYLSFVSYERWRYGSVCGHSLGRHKSMHDYGFVLVLVALLVGTANVPTGTRRRGYED